MIIVNSVNRNLSQLCKNDLALLYIDLCCNYHDKESNVLCEEINTCYKCPASPFICDKYHQYNTFLGRRKFLKRTIMKIERKLGLRG